MREANRECGGLLWRRSGVGVVGAADLQLQEKQGNLESVTRAAIRRRAILALTVPVIVLAFCFVCGG